jgi:SpoVK/Ycf46/Vps4 family AAA+-type ATPase
MFRTDMEIVLTDRAINLFFPKDADLLIKKSINSSNLLKADSISSVELFFNREESEVLGSLRKLLTLKGYAGVVRRLKAQGLRRGFTILFHGSPGTGKTEAVYQLARKANRDIMKVDLSQTKSMWFGESEKKVKDIFNQYRALCSFSTRTPILLFNEADGIFGERRQLKDNSSSQTFNTMQNILLEELENFEGILIATTNLTGNFDRAFERRFLYKIRFSGPDEHTRARIWRSKIKGIPPELARTLAREFSLSGGQIENVTRKYHIDGILHNSVLSYASLSSYCRAEVLAKRESRAVGFKQSTADRES